MNAPVAPPSVMPPGSVPPTAAELEQIAAIAHAEAGIVISPGKGSMVQSRLAKRLRALGMSDYGSYLDYVRSDAGREERQRMISQLTTNVSHFFRENHHFEIFRDKVLPELAARAKTGGRVRLWSAGCSNGQEAYSMAMTVLEALPDAHQRDVRILASDIDPMVVARGRAAEYDAQTVSPVPEAMRRKYLEPAGANYRLCAAARGLVTFRELNLHAAWPMKGKFDAIFCRNVVIYFDPPAQAALWQRFGGALAPGGWLFVGHSERVPAGPGTPFDTAGITTYRLRGGTPQ